MKKQIIQIPLVAFAGMVSATLSAATIWTGNANDGDLFGTADNWDTGLPGNNEQLAIINNGDTVSLATNYTGTNTYNLEVGGNSTLNASADFTSTGLTIQNTGTVNLTGGAFTLPQTSTNNNGNGADGVLLIAAGGTLDISGGDHIFNERTVMDTGSTFRVTGSDATISMNQIGTGNGTFDFVFDTAGVSTITGDLSFPWFSIGNSLVTVNASAVAGIVGSYTLFDCDASGTMMGAGAFTIAGLGTEGVDWNLVITDNAGGGANDTIVLNVIPEPGSYALLGGLLALSSVMVRRRKA